MKRLLVVLILFCAVPAMAQTEARISTGFSDTASFTGGVREPVFRIGGEGDIRWHLRLGGSFTKEGLYTYDGWGVELTVGSRHRLPWKMQGTIREGIVWTMQSSPSAGFTAGPQGAYQDWQWRTVELNGPFLHATTAYPFVSYSVQRRVAGRYFVEVQLRVSRVPTIKQWAAGTVGAMTGYEQRATTAVPGYSIGIGYAF